MAKVTSQTPPSLPTTSGLPHPHSWRSVRQCGGPGAPGRLQPESAPQSPLQSSGEIWSVGSCMGRGAVDGMEGVGGPLPRRACLSLGFRVAPLLSCQVLSPVPDPATSAGPGQPPRLRFAQKPAQETPSPHRLDKMGGGGGTEGKSCSQMPSRSSKALGVEQQGWGHSRLWEPDRKFDSSFW